MPGRTPKLVYFRSVQSIRFAVWPLASRQAGGLAFLPRCCTSRGARAPTRHYCSNRLGVSTQSNQLVRHYSGFQFAYAEVVMILEDLETRRKEIDPACRSERSALARAKARNECQRAQGADRGSHGDTTLCYHSRVFGDKDPRGRPPTLPDATPQRGTEFGGRGWMLKGASRFATGTLYLNMTVRQSDAGAAGRNVAWAVSCGRLVTEVWSDCYRPVIFDL